MKHPTEQELALFAGGDLRWWERLRVGSHLSRCEACRGEVARTELAVSVLADAAAALPPGLDWQRLAPQLHGNVRVGLAAARCVTPALPAQRLGWKPALAMTCVTGLLVSAWWLRVPERGHAPVQQVVRTAAIVMPAAVDGRTGVELQTSGGSLTLLTPRAASPAVYTSTPGSLRARYVDADTGQVTINNVYAE